ncbi:ABC transporter permease [Clostridium cadaveris]
MKKIFTHLSKSSILIFTLTIITLFFSIGVSEVKNFRDLAYEKEYHVGNNCIEFNINNFQSSSYEKVLNSIIENSNYNLFNTRMLGSSYQANGIYLNENLKVSPSIIEGRFFTKDDFSISYSKNLAVIGKGLLDNTKIINGEKYIFFNNEMYKVIGVMGDKKRQMMLDYTLIFNLKDLFIENEFPKTNDYWYISSLDESADLYGVIDKANKVLKESTDASLTASKYNINPNPTLTALKGTKNMTLYFGFFAAVISLNMFIIVKQWLSERIKEIGVRKAFGATNRQIYLLIFKEYILISLISSLIALLIQSILIHFSLIDVSIGLAFINFLAITVFSFIFSSLLLIISIKELNKLPENTIMKGSL